MLLILSEKADEHVPFVLPTLAEGNEEVLWFDPARYPSEARASIAFRSGRPRHSVLRLDGQEHDLASVEGVWYRRPQDPLPGDDVTETTHRRLVELTAERFLDGLWALTGCRWLPAPPAVERAADNKLVQLQAAAEVGFLIPDTLVTNDPDDFLAFYGETDQLVSKSLVNTNVDRRGEAHLVLYTHPVRRRDVPSYRTVRHAPVVFQEYVPKRVELRVTVVGASVFAAEIESQRSRTTRHDWRRYDDPRVRYGVHFLPPEVERQCVEVVAALGLNFGAIDLILRPDGRYVFLEVNTNGQWGAIEMRTGLPIADAIAGFLTGRQRPRQSSSTGAP